MKIKGNGTVRPIKNKQGKPVKNSWQLVLSLGADPMTGKRKQVTRAFHGTKTEARKALEEFRRELEYGLKVDADKVTFEDYAKQWLDARRAAGNLAPATIKRNEQVLARINGHLGDARLGDIEPATVRNLYAALSAEGLATSTVAKIAVVLNQILRQAVDDDIILRNPCDRVKAPKQQKSKVSQALDRKELSRLLRALAAEEAIEHPYAKLPQQKKAVCTAHVMAAKVAVLGGLRRGEVLGLSWEDVNFNTGELHVRHSLCKETGELKAPKTESGDRYVVLDPQTLADLENWKSMQAKYLFSLGLKRTGKTAVITGEAGDRIDGNNLARWWRRFCSKYGFEGLRFHDLRHTHASTLVSSGLNIKAVSSRLGHASVGLTLDLYSHAQREDDEKAASVMGRIRGASTQPLGKVVNL